MKNPKKTPYNKKSFESDGSSSDTSANIYMTMILSKAWMDLTARQRLLYLYCKAQYYAEKVKPNNDKESFTMNQSKWCGLYGLYEKTNAKGFYRDMTALINHGFIACSECGAITRTKSIYRFSSMWQKYGTNAFVVSKQEMTRSMLHKESEKNPQPMANLY